MDEKRIAEIKARAEAATPAPWKMVPRAALPFLPTRDHVADVDGHEVQPARDGILGDQTADADFIAHAREDVPFLLEQLERAQRDVAVAADDAEADLKEVLRLKSALAAPEAAAGQMRAALEEVSSHWTEMVAEGMLRSQADPIENRIIDALGVSAGKGWLSPEEAARQKAEIRKLNALRIEDAQEAERLRKELKGYKDAAEVEAREGDRLRKELGEVDRSIAEARMVTEEECARRCREVAEIWYATGKNTGKLTDLSAIIDRVVKKGGG